MMVSDSGDRHLRDLEEQLMVDDAAFVEAFRSRSAVMDDAPQLHAKLHMLGECMVGTAAASIAVLLVSDSYAAAGGLCVLLLAASAFRGRGSAPARRRPPGRRRPLDRRPNSGTT
jgi:hypothetical protein